MKRTLMNTASALTLSLLVLGATIPLTQASAQTTSVTNAEIDTFIRANLNDPAKIAAAMKQYNVNLDRIQQATGYTRIEMADYILKSKNADLMTSYYLWTPPAVTSTEINDYVRANLNDPAKIAFAMQVYKVNLDQIWKATGYTRAEMTDYINNSGNAELKSYLANWTTASPATMADYNKLPSHMKGGISNPNGTPVVIIRDINEIDLLPGLTAAQKLSYKERFAALLANPTNSVMGIGGYEYKIAGTEDPLRAYPAGASAPTPPVASTPTPPVASTPTAPVATAPATPGTVSPAAPVTPATPVTPPVAANPIAPIGTCNEPTRAVPVFGSIKRFKGGYTLDNNGVLKGAKGELAGILTVNGEFIDTKGNTLSAKNQEVLKKLLASEAETVKVSKTRQVGVKYNIENNRLKLTNGRKE